MGPSANQILGQKSHSNTYNSFRGGSNEVGMGEMRAGSTPKYSADEGSGNAPLRVSKKKFKRKFPHLNSLDER